MFIGQKVYLGYIMLRGYYQLTGWEVDVGENMCME